MTPYPTDPTEQATVEALMELPREQLLAVVKKANARTFEGCTDANPCYGIAFDPEPTDDDLRRHAVRLVAVGLLRFDEDSES
jgi:hypothetical protein